MIFYVKHILLYNHTQIKINDGNDPFVLHPDATNCINDAMKWTINVICMDNKRLREEVD